MNMHPQGGVANRDERPNAGVDGERVLDDANGWGELAELVAIKHNPAIKVFHSRLIAASKPKKAAIVACMPKLLTILSAVRRDQSMWNAAKHVQIAQSA
ncbi:MAG: hypothetical protein ABIP61_12370 [Burkholderiaceae bacterium]